MVRYVRKVGVEAAPMAQETVLYDADNRRFCSLNPTAAYLWDCLEHPCDEYELVQALQGHFSVQPSATLEQDVQAAFRQFLELGLILPAPEGQRPETAAHNAHHT